MHSKAAGLVFVALSLSGCVPPATSTAPSTPAQPQPPASPPSSASTASGEPTLLEPSALERMRVAGERTIAPDDATKSQLSALGVDRLIASYRLCLGVDGVPAQLQVLRSSGYPAYDAKLEARMMQWRYRPHTVDGVAKKVCTSVTFVYSQRNDPRDRKPQTLAYAPSPAKLTMLSRGAGPVALVRLTPVRGRKQYVRMTYGEDAVVTFAGQAPKSSSRTSLLLDGITEATHLDEQGNLRYVTAIEKSELTDGGDLARDTLAGAKLEGAASTMGVTSQLQVQPPPNRFVAEGLDPAYKSLATWLILPRDPIAVGAQWEVSTQEPLLDVELSVVTRYTLQARTATSATISGELKVLTLSAPPSRRQILAVTGYGKLEATITQGRLYPQLERALHVEVKSRERIGKEHPVDVDGTFAIDVHHGFSLPWTQP